MSRTKKPYRLKTTVKSMYRERSSYFMIAPFLIAFFIFTVIPVVAAIVLSFTDFNMLQTPNFVGFDNYKTLFLNDDVFIIAVRNTMIMAFITGPVGYIACFIFAWFINELPNKVRSVMTLIFYAPSISGSVYVIWTYILSADRYGLLNGLLMKLGFIDAPILWLQDTDYMLVCCIIVQLWLSLGTSFLSFLAGFKTVDTTLYEAGAIDGVHNRFQEIWFLTLPQMKPQLLFGAVMQISSSFAVGAVPAALCGNPSVDYATHTIINHIDDYGGVRYELGYACAISTVLLLVMLIVNKVINKVLVED
ncbi:MAG: sugar ABC transporter permease [Ruminococcaceae bacterium]|nr:sugar ABC transporter permease [Oscillospiraceae bacterium]